MDPQKKKIFFVGKTFSDKFLDKVQKQFKVVKSLSKQVSILVYVPNTKGAKTQLEKSKDLNIEKLTLTDFYNKYMSDLDLNNEEFLSNNKKPYKNNNKNNNNDDIDPTKPPSISEPAISDNDKNTTSDSGPAFIGKPTFKAISDNDDDDTTSDDLSPKFAGKLAFKSEPTLNNAIFNDDERKKMVEQWFTPKDKISGFLEELIMNDNFYNITINKNYK